MASIYARGNRIWCKLKHADGKWRASRTPFGPGSEQQAQRYADEAQRQIDGKAPRSDESMTVEAWSVSWLKGRREKHESTSRRYETTGSGKVQYRGHRGDSSMMRLHVLPYIGALLVADVDVRHLTGWIHTLRTTTALSTTTIRNVYGLASTMFRDAAIAGLAKKKRQFYEESDRIRHEQDRLIAQMETQLKSNTHTVSKLFELQWHLARGDA